MPLLRVASFEGAVEAEGTEVSVDLEQVAAIRTGFKKIVDADSGEDAPIAVIVLRSGHHITIHCKDATAVICHWQAVLCEVDRGRGDG